MTHRLVALLFVAVIAAGSAAAADNGRRRSVLPPAVPAEYRNLYAQLASQLDAARAQSVRARAATPGPLYAAELLPANGNRGPELLQPSVMGGVRLFLDRFQELGVRGVVFNVPYPLLVDRFPNSGQYLEFYRQVVAEVRRRGMTVDIESAVLFANSPFSPVQWDYSATPFADFAKEQHDMTAKIVSQLAPDYLNLGSEPDTEARLTGYSQLNNPATWAATLAQTIQGIDRGRTKIGSGLGTWNSVAFVNAEADLPLDFISLHLYPINAASVATAHQAAAIARAHGKELIIDESWLFKMRDGETTGIAADATIFARDAFSFFAPLDEEFIDWLDGFARSEGVTFVSLFWSTYLFSYIPYSPATAAQPYATIVQQVNAAAASNIMSDAFSRTGEYLRSLIARRR